MLWLEESFLSEKAASTFYSSCFLPSNDRRNGKTNTSYNSSLCHVAELLAPFHLHQERMHSQYCKSPLTSFAKVLLVLQTLIMNNLVGFNTRKLTKLMGIYLTNAWDFYFFFFKSDTRLGLHEFSQL